MCSLSAGTQPHTHTRTKNTRRTVSVGMVFEKSAMNHSKQNTSVPRFAFCVENVLSNVLSNVFSNVFSNVSFVFNIYSNI